MIRRVTHHKKMSKDGEMLSIITVYEQGVNREIIKNNSPYCKKHHVLVKNGNSYEYK